MELPSETLAVVVTALLGGGGVAGVYRWRNGSAGGELLAAVREQTRVTVDEGDKTRSAIQSSSEITQSGLTQLAIDTAELTGFLKAKL